MEFVNLFSQKLSTLNEVATETLILQKDNLTMMSNLFTKTLRSEKTIFWCGNGGSASESSHLATELIGRFKGNRVALPSVSLNADTTAITCIANDFGYDEIFARQLSGLGKTDDLLIVLSTSGNSSNVLKALEQASLMGIKTIALLGKDGGRAKDKADYQVVVPSQETARIQEVHLLIGHTLCEIAELDLGLV
jgi:D-sedoheptulose 7-phosphate isomerase